MALVQFNTGCFIMQKQVKNNVWQSTTAGKYASQRFSASCASSAQGLAPPAECHDRKIYIGS